MATKTEMWDVGDYCSHFLHEAEKSSDETFKSKFKSLAHELESMDAEFMRETAGCGRELGTLIEECHSLAGRLGYCESPRGFEGTCDELYRDVDSTIEHARSMNERCFL